MTDEIYDQTPLALKAISTTYPKCPLKSWIGVSGFSRSHSLMVISTEQEAKTLDPLLGCLHILYIPSVCELNSFFGGPSGILSSS